MQNYDANDMPDSVTALAHGRALGRPRCLAPTPAPGQDPSATNPI